jgi:hypothetical protein
MRTRKWKRIPAPAGAVVCPETGRLVAITTDAARISGLATSTLSRLAAEGLIQRSERFLYLDDIEAMKPKLRPPGRPPGALSKNARAFWKRFNAAERARRMAEKTEAAAGEGREL